MAITRKNTSYQVRPDKHTSESINNLNPEDGVIVFDKDIKSLKVGKDDSFEEIYSNPKQIGKKLIGWQDFADGNTTLSNPITQTNVNGGEIRLTNDNNGTLTDGNTNVNAETTVDGLNDMWDTTSNTLVFKDTGIEKNDVILLRVHVRINSSIIEQDFDIRLDFYDDVEANGNFVFGFKKQIHTETLSAGVFREKMTDMKFFVGESILNGSATINLEGTKSFEATVIGWNLTILKIAR